MSLTHLHLHRFLFRTPLEPCVQPRLKAPPVEQVLYEAGKFAGWLLRIGSQRLSGPDDRKIEKAQPVCSQQLDNPLVHHFAMMPTRGHA